MARLVGVDLPRDKRIEVGLTYIYGIGLTTSKKILAETGVDPSVRVKDLTEDDLTKLRDYIQANIKVEGDLHDLYHLIVYEEEELPVLGLDPLAERIWQRLSAAVLALLSEGTEPK